MGYIKISWPHSQILMELTEDDMEEYGVELGEDCSYFVPEEDYEEIMELAENRLNESLDDDRGEKPWDYGKHFD